MLNFLDLVGIVKLVDRVLEAEIEQLVLKLLELRGELVAG